MKITDYIAKYLPEAKKVESETGIPAVAILAQSAGENGWKEAPGNMMFGIKDTDGLNGNEQLIRTKEYHPHPNVKYPKIHSITEVIIRGTIMYKYIVDDWFRKYDSPADSFRDYANFILKNQRYEKALSFRHDPEQYLREIARAGYATNPGYEDYLISMLKSVTRRI